MISISGYQITEELYESSNTLVYRGQHNVDNQPVILNNTTVIQHQSFGYYQLLLKLALQIPARKLRLPKDILSVTLDYLLELEN